LGIEVFKAGIGKLLLEIEKRNLKNVRIIQNDAQLVIPCLRESSVSAFHIFFPDPWHKTKHNKRRLIRRPFTDLLASRLTPDGCIHFVTDWEDYAAFALEELVSTPGLQNKFAGYAPRPEDRPETKFEKKGLQKKHTIYDIIVTKKH
jgi:tRNA (guanine-N7-)-methyltransferase